MKKINRDTLNVYQNVYRKRLKKYTTPKIYNAGGDMSKRWYVYYYFRNPETQRLQLQNPIFNGVNYIKDKKERISAINNLRDIVEHILEDGFDPYASELPQQMKTNHYLEECVLFAFDYWQKTISENALRDYKSRINRFKTWSYQNGLRYTPIDKYTKKHIISFLNETLKTSSPKNRNNYRITLSAFFSLLEKNDYVEQNPVSSIEILKVKVQRNRTYSSVQQEDIFAYLQQNDPQLFLFVKFVSYNFLRPIEVARLQVKDINFKDKLLTVKTKTTTLKTKIIPDILLQDLDFLQRHPKEHYIFAPQGTGLWNATETNRRDYWSKRFKKVKEVFNLNEDYGIYSFRHTFITNLYRELRKTLTPFEVKSHLMLITGHSTMTALEKYLRDIDAELPEDYSHLIAKIHPKIKNTKQTL